MTRASQFALLWIATTSLAALSLDQGATAQTALDPQLLQAPADGGARRWSSPTEVVRPYS